MIENENAIESTFELFVIECNHGEMEVRVNAIKRLCTVAFALDVEKTKTELIPYLDTLAEGTYNDDEVLFNLAEQLGNFLPFVGGTNNIHLIISILEKLTALEENIVREKATESLEKLACDLDQNLIEEMFVPLIVRLANSQWFTAKSASASLFTVCYSKIGENKKDDLRNLYTALCQDDSPLVRRSAAIKLSEFLKVLELKCIMDEFIPIFHKFAADDQDSVRVLAVDVGISIAWRLEKTEIEVVLLTVLQELAGDPSWRVRNRVADQINSMQTAFGYELTGQHLVDMYENLVHDPEPQVREVSAKRLVEFCEILQDNFKQTTNKPDCSLSDADVVDPIILEKMFPLVQYLDEDVNSDVKEGLALVLTSLSPILGVEYTRKLLFPLIAKSLLNDSFRVKENIISNLNNIISIIGVSDIADVVLKIVLDLVNNSASLWRTRRNLIVTINYIAGQLGKEYFDVNLKDLYGKLLNDGVYAVRKTAPLILPVLIKKFGFNWAMNSVIPSILVFGQHKHYLYRFVCLFCIDELVTPTLESKNVERSGIASESKYFQHVRHFIFINDSDKDTLNCSKDFLNRIKKLNQLLNVKLQEEWVKDVLKILEENYVVDDDIEMYAENTINIFCKDDSISAIRNVSNEEICGKFDDSYLEGVLNLILNHYLEILSKLSKDNVPNVALNVAKTLKKISQFSLELEEDLGKEWVAKVLKDYAEKSPTSELAINEQEIDAVVAELLNTTTTDTELTPE